ncbi:PhoH family protein [Antricoccus suffuscus]|nr:PhoH family protein [Antricoccus suffuscus]
MKVKAAALVPRTDKQQSDHASHDEPQPDVVTTASLEIPSTTPMVSILGVRDELLRVIEASVGAQVHVRGNTVTLSGPAGEVAFAERVFDELLALVDSGHGMTADAVRRTIDMLRNGSSERPADVLSFNILSRRGRAIRPKTVNQKRYVDAIDENTITFGIGPAGTGKTYLAMAKAVQALQNKEANRIILTRPAVEAGERLGFLPGTLYEKIDPYLRPLYDALHDMIDPESIPRLMAAGTIEVAPLAYMRGRTLNDAFIILDEAQNSTAEQMKMFLTRLGFGAKIVVTGDVTQIDLPGGQKSGLRVVRSILDGLDDIKFVELTSTDVVRHRLVGDIVDAYARFDEDAASGPPTRSSNGEPRRHA